MSRATIQRRARPAAPADKPLAGRRIVITRAADQSRELIERLERKGAEVLSLPAVRFAPPEKWTALDAGLRQLPRFDWVLFTSANAVRFFAARAAELRVATRDPSDRPRIAAVGPATAEAAAQQGIHVDFLAQDHSGEGLAAELREAAGRGASVFLPRSDRADDRLPTALWEAGARVTEAVAYRTLPPDTLDPAIVRRIRDAAADAIVFASPSAFQNLSLVIPPSELAKLSRRMQFTAIGPTTARALREAGVSVAIEARESSAAGLARAIGEFYRREPPLAQRVSRNQRNHRERKRRA